MRLSGSALRLLSVVCLAVGTLVVVPSGAQASPSTTAAVAVPAESAAVLAERRLIIQHAQALVIKGTNYTWGGGHGAKPGLTYGSCGKSYQGPLPCKDTKVRGLDCSGYVRYVLSLSGQGDFALNANGFLHSSKLRTITKSQLKPGDLIFFGSTKGTASHVAIYAGDGRMYEAANHALDVTESPITRRSDVIAYKTLF